MPLPPAGVRTALCAVAALLLLAVGASSASANIIGSSTTNTQIRVAADQSATGPVVNGLEENPARIPDFSTAAWKAPVSGHHGAYSTLPGAAWLGETRTWGGQTVNPHWTEYRASFDLPSGTTAAGVRFLVDNELVRMTINRHEFGCSLENSCEGFTGLPFARSIPSEHLTQTGNELRLVVLNHELTPSYGGLTFSVVPAGIRVVEDAGNVTGSAGRQMAVTGEFAQELTGDQDTHPLTLTADNADGTFTDHGDGKWTWTYTPSAAHAARTITVTAEDDRGLKATDSFSYTATAPRGIALVGGDCVTRGSTGYLDAFQVKATGLPANQYHYVFAETAPGQRSSYLGNLVQYEYARSASDGSMTLTVDNRYRTVPLSTTTIYVNVRPSSWSLGPLAESAVPVCASDTTPPVIEPTVSGTEGDNGWHTSDVAVSWKVSDAQSVVSSTSGCSSVSVTDDTAGRTFTCRATSAGGTAERSVTVKRDATAPTITAARSPQPNTAGWNNSDVTVGYDCADALSGLASCAEDDVLASEGADQTAWGAAVDNAGNRATASVSHIDIDKTVPSVVLTGGGSYTVDQTVTIGCSASDLLSGVASDTCSTVRGSKPAYEYDLGQTTLSAAAVDRADNESSASTVVEVSVTFDSLCVLVERWVTQKGVARSLCAKLAAAEAADARGRMDAKAGQLGAFRNQVQAQTGTKAGKSIAPAHAEILLRLSEAL